MDKTIVDHESNRFAIGQNFIRQVGMVLHFSVREKTNEVTLTTYLGRAKENES